MKGLPDWQIHREVEVASTNDEARTLPAWHAVVAERQTAGRGRHGRSFSSASGGLWLSAVLPIPDPLSHWTGLALGVAWGILESLPELPVAKRLRWPNDLMIDDRKLGGILLEQSAKDLCVVGVGLNITNDPSLQDEELTGKVGRLAEFIPLCPAAGEWVEPVLRGIKRGYHRFEDGRLVGMMDCLNTSWGGSREVCVELLEGEAIEGTFLGIDEQGALVLRLPDGGGRVFPAHVVGRMVEL